MDRDDTTPSAADELEGMSRLRPTGNHTSLAAKRLAVEWIPFRGGKFGEEALVKRALWSTPLFENLSAHNWRLMSDLFHLRRYEAGEVIFEQGTPGLGMYVIVEGRVKIVTEEDGKEVILTHLSEGDFFGEMSLIDEIERSATAIAEVQTKLVGLFRPQLKDLMIHRPRLGITLFERLAKIVVKRLRHANQLMAIQVNEQAKKAAEIAAEAAADAAASVSASDETQSARDHA